MQSQSQFLRQTGAASMASGLIAGLLPGFAAAQDLSTVEARTAWVIEQRRGESIRPNAKFGAAAALVRLALNPDDAEVIDRITHFYYRVPSGRNGEQFTYPGVAWVLGTYWDKFTPAQRDHLKAKIKGFPSLMGHGTENHALMKCAAAYLFAQYWPDETGWVRGAKTSAHVMETARGRLLAVMKGLYDKSYFENLSHNYAPVHLYPYYVLYDCATDPEVKAAADAALHFHVANMAANHFEGVTIPPANRDYPNTTWNTYTFEPGKRHAGHLIHWFYWADTQNWTPAEIDRSDGNFVVYAALSGWRPPAAIESLARGQTVPSQLTASSPSFSHNDEMSGSPGEWGTGNPGECVRYVYRDKLCAMGSGFFQYYPDEIYLDFTMFRLIYKSPDRFNFIECYHPYWRSDARAWQGLNSPFQQTAQHRDNGLSAFRLLRICSASKAVCRSASCLRAGQTKQAAYTQGCANGAAGRLGNGFVAAARLLCLPLPPRALAKSMVQPLDAAGRGATEGVDPWVDTALF